MRDSSICNCPRSKNGGKLTKQSSNYSAIYHCMIRGGTAAALLSTWEQLCVIKAPQRSAQLRIVTPIDSYRSLNTV